MLLLITREEKFVFIEKSLVTRYFNSGCAGTRRHIKCLRNMVKLENLEREPIGKKYVNHKKLFPYIVLLSSNSKVLLDMGGHHFTQGDFDCITREHCNAQDRIKEVGDYQHLIICLLRGFL